MGNGRSLVKYFQEGINSCFFCWLAKYLMPISIYLKHSVQNGNQLFFQAMNPAHQVFKIRQAFSAVKSKC